MERTIRPPSLRREAPEARAAAPSLLGERPTPAGTLRWELYPRFQLRTAGFPASQLLSLEERPDALCTSHALDDRLRTAGEELRTLLEEAPAGRDVSAALGRVAAGLRVRPPRVATPRVAEKLAEWNGLVERRGRVDEELRRWYEARRRRSFAQLAEICGHDRFREAVALSSPEFYDAALAPGRRLSTERRDHLDAKGRRDLRTVHLYLSRFVAKTEVSSFFGPVLIAGWDRLTSWLRVGTAIEESCSVDLSSWLARALDRSSADRLEERDGLWTRDPVWRRDGSDLVRPVDGARAGLRPLELRVWEALDRPRRPDEIAASLQTAKDDVQACLRRLGPTVRRWPRLPDTEIHALAWLRRTRPHDGAAAALAALVRAIERDRWPRTHEHRERVRDFVAGLGLPTSRRPGEHYADRDVLHEDRSSPWSGRVSFGSPALRSLQDGLADLLPLMYLDASLRKADAQEALRRVTGGRPRPLLELAAIDLPDVSWRADRLGERLTALVEATGERSPVSLDPAEVEAAAADLWELAPPDAERTACLPGLDVMIDGRPEEGRWVLTECHDDSSSVFGGVTSRVQPGGLAEFGRFSAAVERLVARPVATIVGRRRSRHVTPELPGLSIELTGTSSKDRSEVAAAADVWVTEDGYVSYRDRRYVLYPGDLASSLSTALSLPSLRPLRIGRGAHTPRVQLGRLVIQRATWRVDLPLHGRGAAGWLAAQRWARSLGLPQRVFVRHPGEPKPIYVGFADVVGVDHLLRLPPAPVVVSEALPDLERTWWNPARESSSHAAELRLPLFVEHVPKPRDGRPR